LQKYVDSWESAKLLIQKDGINTENLTIYEFMQHLNRVLTPKKLKENGK